MAEASVALSELAEKGPDAELLRDMIQYVAQRMMEMGVEGRCAAAYGQRSPRSGPTAATATGIVISTPVPAPSTSRSLSCVPGATFRNGCWSGASGPSGRSRRWWRPATCSVCPPDGWNALSNPSVSRIFPSLRCRSWPESSTRRLRRFAPARWMLARTRSWPLTPWCSRSARQAGSSGCTP